MFFDRLLQPIDKLFKNISSAINDPTDVFKKQNNIIDIITNPFKQLVKNLGETAKEGAREFGEAAKIGSRTVGEIGIGLGRDLGLGSQSFMQQAFGPFSFLMPIIILLGLVIVESPKELLNIQICLLKFLWN